MRNKYQPQAQEIKISIRAGDYSTALKIVSALPRATEYFFFQGTIGHDPDILEITTASIREIISSIRERGTLLEEEERLLTPFIAPLYLYRAFGFVQSTPDHLRHPEVADFLAKKASSPEVRQKAKEELCYDRLRHGTKKALETYQDNPEMLSLTLRIIIEGGKRYSVFEDNSYQLAQALRFCEKEGLERYAQLLITHCKTRISTTEGLESFVKDIDLDSDIHLEGRMVSSRLLEALKDKIPEDALGQAYQIFHERVKEKIAEDHEGFVKIFSRSKSVMSDIIIDRLQRDLGRRQD